MYILYINPRYVACARNLCNMHNRDERNVYLVKTIARYDRYSMLYIQLNIPLTIKIHIHILYTYIYVCMNFDETTSMLYRKTPRIIKHIGLLNKLRKAYTVD